VDQLPIFVNLQGRNVLLLGEGEAADAKRRLIERAGAKCLNHPCPKAFCTCARIAFVAIDDADKAIAAAEQLRSKGLLVNVVDRSAYCDFTTPAIIDRDPVIIAIGTGGASAGLAKALRQRIEALLPAGLGQLARNISASRDAIRLRWPTSSGRRRALDKAFATGGALDPTRTHLEDVVANWLTSPDAAIENGLIEIRLISYDPDDLSLRAARLLGEADHIYCEANMPPALLNRARADAVRHIGQPPALLPGGLCLLLRLPLAD
jgi:uroporphyrin-III C-methyltransferase / precorrin-2 dehydrogenase / sirohydrochlorin ferrochelatase